MSVKMALRKRAAARVDLTLPPPPPSPPKSPTGSGGENGHRSPPPPVGERRRTPPPPPVARRVVISKDLRHAIKELRAVPVLRCPGTVEFLDDVDFGNRNGGGGGNVEIGSSSTGVPDGGVSTGNDRMFESSAPSANGVAATDSFQSETTIVGNGSLTTTMLTTTTATRIWNDTTAIRSATTTSTSRPCKQFVEVVDLASPPGDAEPAPTPSGGVERQSSQLSPPYRDPDVATPTTATDDEVFADDWKLTAVRRAAALGSTDRHDDEDIYEQAMDELDSIDAEVVDVEPQSASDELVVDAMERDRRSPAGRRRGDDGGRRTQEQLVLSTYREVTRLNGDVFVGGTSDSNGDSGRASGAVASPPADDVGRASSSSRNVDGGADVVEVWTLADWTNLSASSPLSPNDDTSAEELFEEIMESMKDSVEQDDDDEEEVVVVPSGGGTVNSPSRVQNGSIGKTTISTSSSTSESPPTTVIRRPRSTVNESSGAMSISTTTMTTTTTETAQVCAPRPTDDGPTLRSSMDETLKQKILNERLASVLNECLDVLTVAAPPATADRVATAKTNASVVEAFPVAVADEKKSTVAVLKTQRPPTSIATARSTEPQKVRRRSPIDICSPSASSCDFRRTTSSSTTSSGRERGCRTSTSSGIQSDELDVDIDEEFGANAAFDVDGRRTVISNESLDSLLDSLLECNVGEQMMADRTLGTCGGPTPRVSRTTSRTASGRSGTDAGRREEKEKENDAVAIGQQQKASSAVVDVSRRSGTNGNVERTPEEVALVGAEAKAVAPYTDKSPRMEILSDELITQEIVLKIAWPKAARRKMPPTTTKTTNRSSSKSKATKGQLIPVCMSDNIAASTPSPFRDLHVHRVIRITDVDGDEKATGDRLPIDACGGDDVLCSTRIAVGGPPETGRRLAVTTDLAAAATQNGVDACVELDRRATSTTNEEQPDGSRYQVVRADRMRVVRLPVVRATDADPTGSHVADGGGIGSVVDEFGRALVEERRLRHLPADIRVTCEAVERRSANDDVTVVHRTLIDDVGPRPPMVAAAEPRPPASTLLTTAVD